MNNRDPFDLRRTSGPAHSLLQSRQSRLGDRNVHTPTRVLESESEAGGESVEATVDMSSYAPNFQNGAIHRNPEVWQSSQSRYPSNSHSNMNGISEKVAGFFGDDSKDALPMYKDKPYGYPGRRKHKWYRQKRTVAIALTSLALISWWFGILSPLSYFTSDETTVPVAKDKSKSSWFSGGKVSAAEWESRAEKVKDAFKLSFNGYEKHAWGYDEFNPVSKNRRQMTPKGLGWIIIDALDTMMLMNLTSELSHARQWIHDDLTYDQDHDVNTFETTIRMLGGLLSAHYLSTQFPGVYAPVEDELSDDLYIEKASDLADRLLGAYETNSGVPWASINLHSGAGIPSHTDGGASSTAEATSLQLEMKYLAKLTGEDNYWDRAEHVMKVVDDNNPQDGLVPIFIYADKGSFRGDNIRFGSRGDSYYEYLIKQYLQTSEQEPVYQAMWNETMAGMKKHLITYSFPNNFTVLGERPSGLERAISPKMDHLVCFLPGTIALATTGGKPLAEARAQPNWGAEQEEDMRLAEELMNTCWGMYKVAPIGLAGEITHFTLHDPPLMYNDFAQIAKPASPDNFDKTGLGSDFVGHGDFFIKGADSHNLQRPETAESLFYMWRITGDERYRQWGWEMFEAFRKYTVVEDGTGYSSLNTVLRDPPPLRDNMESFWLAETLKYFYLLFSSNEILPLTDVVFNTEAHPFPRFELGKLFTTGWQRKPRDENGRIILEAKPEVETRTEKSVPTEVQQVVVDENAKGRTLGDNRPHAEPAKAQDALTPEGPAGGLDPITGKEKEGAQ